jgi:hypothetical protein
MNLVRPHLSNRTGRRSEALIGVLQQVGGGEI